jgi:hypothetical protein
MEDFLDATEGAFEYPERFELATEATSKSTCRFRREDLELLELRGIRAVGN